MHLSDAGLIKTVLPCPTNLCFVHLNVKNILSRYVSLSHHYEFLKNLAICGTASSKSINVSDQN